MGWFYPGYAEDFHAYLPQACPRGAGGRDEHRMKDLIHFAHNGIPTCFRAEELVRGDLISMEDLRELWP